MGKVTPMLWACFTPHFWSFSLSSEAYLHSQEYFFLLTNSILFLTMFPWSIFPLVEYEILDTSACIPGLLAMPLINMVPGRPKSQAWPPAFNGTIRTGVIVKTEKGGAI